MAHGTGEGSAEPLPLPVHEADGSLKYYEVAYEPPVFT